MNRSTSSRAALSTTALAGDRSCALSWSSARVCDEPVEDGIAAPCGAASLSAGDDDRAQTCPPEHVPVRRDGVVEGLYVKRVGELHQPVGERVRILTVRGRCARMDGLDAPERFGEAAVGVVDAGAVEAENPRCSISA